MSDVITRAMALWREPVPTGEQGLAAFRGVYADPVVVNGVATALAVLVDRARMLQDAVADLTHHIDELVVTPGRRAFAFRIAGRHVGPLVTPLGTLPATGRPVEVAGMDIFHVDESIDRVTGVWAIADYAGLLVSLGAAAMNGSGPGGLGAVGSGGDDAVPGGRVTPATEDDVGELLVLQRCCWVAEAVANDTFEIPALHETLEDVRAWLREWSTWCLRVDGRLVAAVRARREGARWEIGRLMVAPDLSGGGIGRWLLRHAEEQAPAAIEAITLFTGLGSVRNLTIYEQAGYRRTPDPAPPHAVRLVKRLDPDVRPPT